MTFTVIWILPAENALATLWTAGPNRSAISGAADRIDRLLKHDPQRLGVPLFDTVRGLAVAPLAVEFEVLEQDRLVYVLSDFRTN